MNIKVFLLSTLFFFAVCTTVYAEPIDPPSLDKAVASLNSDERLFLADNASGNPTGTGDRDEIEQKDYFFSMGENWRGVGNPGSDIFPRYIANPLRPMISLSRINLSESKIPGAGDNRYVFRLGGRYGFLRIHPTGEPNRGFQLDLEGAFLGVFDIENSLDNIGWDGLYGILFSWANGRGLALKFGTKHDSSHVGDEYAESTGRKRINYTREEILLGVSLSGFKYWRIYGEGAYGWDLRNKAVQERWRVEGGIEFQDAERWWDGSAGYYAALDVTSYEENDWHPDVTIQAGLVLPVKKRFRTYRLGLEYHNGRPLIGEFFQIKEKYFAIGLWMEL
jgi:hypothetical protein